MSTYIKLSTNEYPRHIGDIEIDPMGMEDYAIVEQTPAPEFDKKTQICQQGTPQIVDGVWKSVWDLRDLTEEELQKREQLRKTAKENRERAIKEMAERNDIPQVVIDPDSVGLNGMGDDTK